jgi:hypothetical protein
MKMTEAERILRKLDRPPAGANWVRFVFDGPEQTAKAILAFAFGQPRFNYQTAYCAVKDRIELGISEEQALNLVLKGGAPDGRKPNKELVKAFFEYDAKRCYSAANPISFEREFFRVSRDVEVPVAPLSIIRERGMFVPIFVTGWSENPLTLTQRRLLMTVYEDAFLSLTDYQESPAEILFFPKVEIDEEQRRKAEVWQRGDYELLSANELNESVDIFLAARSMAREEILNKLSRKGDKEESRVVLSADHPDLFRDLTK